MATLLTRIRERFELLTVIDIFAYVVLIGLLGYPFLREPLGLPKFTPTHALIFFMCYLCLLYLSMLRFHNKRLTEESVLRKKVMRLERRVAFLEGKDSQAKENQAISFAYGNAKLSNPNVTRSMVVDEADKLKNLNK